MDDGRLEIILGIMTGKGDRSVGYIKERIIC